MNKFLEISHKALNGLVKYDKIHIVLGNESCDLDSAVSSLVYAFYLDKKCFASIDTKTVVVPVFNISNEEFPLRTETKYLLTKHNISFDNLTFRDHLDLDDLNKCNKLVLSLVDHHILPENEEHLNNSILEVVDHRPIDPKISPIISKRVIEEVGSCCTLIANIILTENQDILTAEMAKLLYSTIILDTVNFNNDANRYKDLDFNVINKLEKLFKIEECRENIHNELIKARSDISGLTSVQILQKDMKIVNGLPIPGVPMLFSEFIKFSDAQDALKLLCVKYNTKIVIPMGLVKKDDKIFRDIGIFTTEICLMKDKLFDVLTSNENLGLEEIHNEIVGLILFRQNNVRLSRKHILPIIKSVTESEIN